MIQSLYSLLVPVNSFGRNTWKWPIYTEWTGRNCRSIWTRYPNSKYHLWTRTRKSLFPKGRPCALFNIFKYHYGFQWFFLLIRQCNEKSWNSRNFIEMIVSTMSLHISWIETFTFYYFYRRTWLSSIVSAVAKRTSIKLRVILVISHFFICLIARVRVFASTNRINSVYSYVSNFTLRVDDHRDIKV